MFFFKKDSSNEIEKNLLQILRSLFILHLNRQTNRFDENNQEFIHQILSRFIFQLIQFFIEQV